MATGVNIDNFETRDSRYITAGVLFSVENPASISRASSVFDRRLTVYVGEKDIDVTGQPIQTEIVPILKTER